MKKFLALLLAAVLVIGLAACATPDPEPPPAAEETPEPPPAVEEPDDTPPEEPADDWPWAITWEEGETPIALITDYGDIDDESFNQGAWEGVLAFAQANDIPYRYIRPASRGSTADNLDAITLAIAGGAQVLVTPGFLFTEAIYVAQEMYPDVHIILLDAVPAPPEGDSYIAQNTVAVLYAEEQSGFLAGYAAVMDGHRSLGFIGGIPVPAVIRFGHGFVEGAEYAAADLGLAEGEVTVRYTYVGSFLPSPETQTLAASWYADGVEVIFAAAGGAGLSVFAAADATADGLAIGVDVDQGGHSDRIITSALKELRVSVSDMLEAFFTGAFPGGAVKMFDASNNGIGLPADFDRFTYFTQSQYDAIFARLAGGAISVSTDISDPNPLEILDLSLVTVTWIG